MRFIAACNLSNFGLIDAPFCESVLAPWLNGKEELDVRQLARGIIVCDVEGDIKGPVDVWSGH